MLKNKTKMLVIGASLLIVAVGAYYIPAVNSRLSWRLESLRGRVAHFFNPPDEAVFLPSTLLPDAALILQTPTATKTPTQLGPTQTPAPSLTPTITPTPLPDYVSLPGVTYVDQKNRWNYCGPANLTMALNFWGWKGTRDDVALVVKPGFEDPDKDFIDRGRLDLNVMPYEMADFVVEETEFSVVVRHGGEIGLLKKLVAAGFPVVIEKGYYQLDTQGRRSWMGHYLFVTGYSDAEQSFIVQDAYYQNKEAPKKNVRVKYEDFEEGWRAFNYLFFLVYPPEKESELFTLLGDWGDSSWADNHALALAEEDIQTQVDINSYFAWFNKGTSLVRMQRYDKAATSYDKAFSIYATLKQDASYRPYRMVWYQTGPYWAYFYTGRYQDVINLANVTLSTPATGPTLEESLYWRALASFALGDTETAFKDMRETVRLNPNFSAGLAKLSEWGLSAK